MKIHQIYTESELRNFTYIIELDDKTALALDPWDDVVVNNALSKFGLSLKAVINTHEHWDHVQGNLALKKEHNCEVWAHENGKNKIPGLTRCLSKDELIDLGNNCALKVMDTPGHTFAHLCLLVLENGKPTAIFTGDTLFNAGVGHCKGGGDVEVLYQTIVEQFHTLADEIKVYPGHEYLENNLNFTLSVEPSNKNAKEWLAIAENTDPSVKPLVTCVGDEKKINAFFRLAEKEIIDNFSVKQTDNKSIFIALRAKRDQW